MQYVSHSTWIQALGVAALLLTAGCKGGGGLSELFGGGSSVDQVASLFGVGGSGGSDGSGGGDGFGDTPFDGGVSGDSLRVPEVATVFNPEPASVALFGGGLAGLAALSRRRARKRS